MSKPQANQTEQKKTDPVIEKKESVDAIKKNGPENLGKLSFTAANKRVMKDCNSSSHGCHFVFEENKSNDIFEIKVEIKKIPAETFTDEKGKTWKRIA